MAPNPANPLGASSMDVVVSFDGRGEKVAICNESRQVTIWDVETGQQLAHRNWSRDTHEIIMFGDSRLFASSATGGCSLWDWRQDRIVWDSDLVSWALLPKAGLFAASSKEPVLHLYDLETGAKRAHSPYVGHSVFRLLSCHRVP